MSFRYANALGNFKAYAIKAHEQTNHFYDDELPYKFHLQAVVRECKKFMYLVNPSDDRYDDDLRFKLEMACWGHDLIEDARQSYNDILKNCGSKEVAEICHSLTCYTGGRTREERMPDWIYEKIRQTPYASFVKLCDRLANVRYGIYAGSSMPSKYKKENKHFIEKLLTNDQHIQLMPMLIELDTLLAQAA